MRADPDTRQQFRCSPREPGSGVGLMSCRTAATVHGLDEVDLGKLAEQKASDPKLRDFASMMVKDHSEANQELKSLAASKNISLPEHVSASQVAGKTKLHALRGESFDKSYIKSQVAAH